MTGAPHCDRLAGSVRHTGPVTDETGPAAADHRVRLRVVTDADAVDSPAPTVPGNDGLQDGADLAADAQPEPQEWEWVAQWRESAEPTPWATGLPLAAFAAVLTGVAVWVLSAGLADRPVLAVVLNLLVAGGLAPAMWLSRKLPVLRWFAGGAAVGVVAGWIAALSML